MSFDQKSLSARLPSIEADTSPCLTPTIGATFSSSVYDTISRMDFRTSTD